MTGIERIYNETVVTVSPDASVEEVAQTMFEESVGSVLVAEDGELRGIVTDRDLTVELLAEDTDYNVFTGDTDLSTVTAADVMTTDPLTVGPDDEVPHVLDQMRDAVARRIPVVEDGEAVGIVTLDDLLVHLAGEHQRLAADTRAIADVIEAESPRWES